MNQLTKGHLILLLSALGMIIFSACSSNNQNHTTAVTTVTPPPHQVLQEVGRPQKISEQMKERGEQDNSTPAIKILSPANNSVVSGPTVQVRLSLAADPMGYRPHKDPATGKGNHIHVILDNQPYEAYYELDQPFELRNVVAGKHTLRVFPSRPWHESYKNEDAFQMTTFTVKAGGVASTPTTTNSGSPNPAAPLEGKEFPSSNAGEIDSSKPLLTYSRPKGEYKDADADPLMIDFWLSNAKLQGDGGEYRVRYIIDDDDAKYIDRWEPIWLAGWISGKHTVRLELVDKDNRPVENGGYNTTSREITVVK